MRLKGVYAIINEINGKFYIGSTLNYGARISMHKQELRNQKHGNNYLQASWNKYGEEAFTFKLVEYVEDDLFLRAREQCWISREKPSYNNAKSAWAGSSPGNGKTKSEISKSLWQNPAYRAKQEGKLINKPIEYWTGKTHSEETKTKISEKLKGKVGPNKGKKCSWLRGPCSDKRKESIRIGKLKKIYGEDWVLHFVRKHGRQPNV